MLTTSLEHTFRRYLRTRDPELLAEVFEATAPELLRRARSLVGDGALAEDLVQETFLVVLERSEGYDPGRSALAYLAGILRHKAQQALDRARRLRPRRLDRPDSVAAHDRDRLIAEDQARAIGAAIARLPALYREVLHLYVEQQRTPARIGAVLGRPAATVRVQLHRALQMLRAALPPALAALVAAGLSGGGLRAAGRPAVPARPRLGAPPLLAGAAAAALLGGLVYTLPGGGAATPPAAVPAARPAVTPAAAPAPRPPASATEGARVALRRLRFRVLRKGDGEPVPMVGAVVHLRPGHDVDFHSVQRRTDAQGWFDLPSDTPAGPCRVLLDRGVAERVDLPAGSLERVFEIDGGVTIAGRVVDEAGQPVAGAGIWVCREPRHPWFGQVVGQTDAGGRYLLVGMEPMSVVGAVAAGRAPAALTAVAVSPVRQRIDLVLRAAHGAVAGRVVDETGAPIAGAVVFVGDRPRVTYRVPGAADLRCMLPTLQAVSDAAGRFRVEDLPVGELQALARAPGRVSRLVTFNVEPGAAAAPTLCLEAGARIAGQVVDAHGAPVAGATVEAAGRSGHEWCRVETSREGRFALDGVRRAYAALLVMAPGYQTRELPPDAVRFDGAPFRVVLREVEYVEGELCGPGGAPVEGEGWEVLVRPPHPERFAAPETHPVTGGRFRVPRPDAGSAWFVSRRLVQPVWVPARVEESVRDGLALRLDGDFAATCWLKGRIVGVDPEALPDVQLMVTLGAWHYCLVPEIDAATGEFKAGWLPPGDYALRFIGRTGRFPSQVVGVRTLRAGQGTDLGAIAIPPAGRLRYSFTLTTGSVRQMRAWVTDAAGRSTPLPAMAGTIALAAGDYLLQAMSTSFRSVRDHTVTVHAGGTATAEFVLPPAHPRRLEFEIPADMDPAAARCRIADASGAVVMDEDFDVRVPGLGEAMLVLDAGRYNVDLREGDAHVRGVFTIDRDTDPHAPLRVALHRAAAPR